MFVCNLDRLWIMYIIEYTQYVVKTSPMIIESGDLSPNVFGTLVFLSLGSLTVTQSIRD
jgi:hypothetical protein